MRHQHGVMPVCIRFHPSGIETAPLPPFPKTESSSIHFWPSEFKIQSQRNTFESDHLKSRINSIETERIGLSGWFRNHHTMQVKRPECNLVNLTPSLFPAGSLPFSWPSFPLNQQWLISVNLTPSSSTSLSFTANLLRPFIYGSGPGFDPPRRLIPFLDQSALFDHHQTNGSGRTRLTQSISFFFCFVFFQNPNEPIPKADSVWAVKRVIWCVRGSNPRADLSAFFQ